MTVPLPQPSPSPARLRYPKAARLVSRLDFLAVQQHGGRPVRDHSLKIGWRLREDSEPARLGLAVGRRLGRAPRRNRIKRVLREAFRLQPGRFPDGVDLVVIPLNSERASDFHEVVASLDSLARKLARRMAEPPSERPDRNKPRPPRSDPKSS